MKGLLGETFRRENKKVAIWLMRQAGRYLPEYREVRSSLDGFLALCYNPPMASKVTMQPIDRFGFDVAIIFSDILVIPHALGMNVEFNPAPILSGFDVDKLVFDISKLEAVFEAVAMTRSQLGENTPLIGFSGCPWTLAAYMIEGSGSKDFAVAKAYAYNNPHDFTRLLDILVEAISAYLCRKIDAGADVIKLFDSWAGLVAGDKFDEWCVEPTRRIAENVRKVHPDVPIIIFPKGAGYGYHKYTDFADVLAIDYTLPLEIAKELQQKTIIQGNLDPIILLSSKEQIRRAVDNILSHLGGKNFIFNLGHGIVPQTPIENVEYLIETVKAYDIK